jgi:hypothetical protein
VKRNPALRPIPFLIKQDPRPPPLRVADADPLCCSVTQAVTGQVVILPVPAPAVTEAITVEAASSVYE